VQDGSAIGRYYFANGGSTDIELRNGNSYISVGIINQQNTTVSLWMEFKQQAISKTLLVILITMGILLFIGLILTIFFAASKYKDNRRTVNPEIAPIQSSRKNMINLTITEINLLFPIFKIK